MDRRSIMPTVIKRQLEVAYRNRTPVTCAKFDVPPMPVVIAPQENCHYVH